MSKANDTTDRAETYRVISARVPSSLPDRVEDLIDEEDLDSNLSAEIRAGLRARIESIEEESR